MTRRASRLTPDIVRWWTNRANSPPYATPMPSDRDRCFAFLAAIPIALLGGLIGLGGAEFRLPSCCWW